MKKFQSLADALPAEQARVRTLVSRYESLRGMPQVNVEPAIMMMQHALAAAEHASAAGDTVAMLCAYKALRDFTG